MKWYNEEQTKELRIALEKEILGWFKVTSKRMFGCPCYLANGKMFAGLVTRGLIITKLDESEKEELNQIQETLPFKVGPRTMKKWVQLNIDSKDLKSILVYVEKSYERAMREK